MASERDLQDRFGYFVARGDLDRVPTSWQVRVGWLAMLPSYLSESDRERERSRTTLLGQVPIRAPLQVLYNPKQILIDTGLGQSPRVVVRHALSVYHEDAFLGYDLQLLRSHPGGLELLRDEAKRVVEGRTRWSSVLQRMTAWPGYHRGLISLAQRALEHEYPDPLDIDPRFASLVGFAGFCNALPTWPDREFYGFDLDKLVRRWR